MTESKDQALQWAADRANMPYDRFVQGLTAAAIQRIQSAYVSRYVYDAPIQSVEEQEQFLRRRIQVAFREKRYELPREIRPGEYQDFLDHIDVHSKQEKQLLESIVREEVREANLAVTRAKLNHFLCWLGGQMMS